MIEAIASGLPVVGVRDEALQGMLLFEPGTRQAFGQASIDLSKKYSIQAQAATLIELYAELIAERASAPAATRKQALLKMR